MYNRFISWQKQPIHFCHSIAIQMRVEYLYSGPDHFNLICGFSYLPNYTLVTKLYQLSVNYHVCKWECGIPANTKHLYNICTTSAQRWSSIVQIPFIRRVVLFVGTSILYYTELPNKWRLKYFPPHYWRKTYMSICRAYGMWSVRKYIFYSNCVYMWSVWSATRKIE